mmetsp:Transcript_70597/g.182037  ORF Transcript_70597/g.182037 Transcript_70597/m.182037 type:complete len:205 (-) Transcript_70597:1752-2366(-)
MSPSLTDSSRYGVFCRLSAMPPARMMSERPSVDSDERADVAVRADLPVRTVLKLTSDMRSDMTLTAWRKDTSDEAWADVTLSRAGLPIRFAALAGQTRVGRSESGSRARGGSEAARRRLGFASCMSTKEFFTQNWFECSCTGKLFAATAMLQPASALDCTKMECLAGWCTAMLTRSLGTSWLASSKDCVSGLTLATCFEHIFIT